MHMFFMCIHYTLSLLQVLSFSLLSPIAGEEVVNTHLFSVVCPISVQHLHGTATEGEEVEVVRGETGDGGGLKI